MMIMYEEKTCDLLILLASARRGSFSFSRMARTLAGKVRKETREEKRNRHTANQETAQWFAKNGARFCWGVAALVILLFVFFSVIQR